MMIVLKIEHRTGASLIKDLDKTFSVGDDCNPNLHCFR